LGLLILGYKRRENLGQRIWDKGRSYWEHIGEHIGNMFGGGGGGGEGARERQWEPEGNTMRTLNPKP